MKTIFILTDNSRVYGESRITFGEHSVYVDDMFGAEMEIPIKDIKEIIENKEQWVDFPKDDAENIFHKWPEIDEFWYTSDLRTFIRPSEALEHANTLSNTILLRYDKLYEEEVQQ